MPLENLNDSVESVPLIELGGPLILEAHDLLKDLQEMAEYTDHVLDFDLKGFKEIMVLLMGKTK